MPTPPSLTPGRSPADWSPWRTADGSWTLRHPAHGQACHSSSGAWLEARERHALPCELASAANRGERVRLLDVGTGLGLNIAAALAQVEPAGGCLDVLTLEQDLAVIDRTLALRGSWAEDSPSEPWHGQVCAALARVRAGECAPGEAVSLGRRSTLRLLVGDARETLAATQPAPTWDAVFLDPFSPRVAPELWEPTFLRGVAIRMRPGAWLSTYTSSLSVRAALSAAGLRCGPGARVGAKREGTVARRGADPGARFDARTERRVARRAALLRAPENAPGGGDHR